MQYATNHTLQRGSWFTSLGRALMFLGLLVPAGLMAQGEGQAQEAADPTPAQRRAPRQPSQQPPAQDGEDQPRKVQVLNADVLQYEEQDGEKVRKLIGNVRLRQDSTLMHCDTAYQYPAENRVKARSNVKAWMQDSVRLWADRMTYDGNTKIVELYDNIRLQQEQNTLTTDRMTYYRNGKYGYYQRGGKLVDSANTLTSQQGYYYADRQEAYFYRDVKLTNPDYVMTTDSLRYLTEQKTAYFLMATHVTTPDSQHLYTEDGYFDTKRKRGLLYQNPYYRDTSYYLAGDTLFYDDSTDRGWAHCNIRMQNQDSTAYVFGDSAAFFRDSSFTYVTDHPYMIQYLEDDTLTLFADTLFAIDDSARSKHRFWAYHDVRLHMQQMQARADSFVYDRVDSVLQLFQDPVLWADSSQITGDTIRIWLQDRSPDSMAVRRKTFVIQQATEQYFNQLKGRDLIGRFRDQALVYFKVIGNGESIYFVPKENAPGYTGMNQATALEIEVFLEDNKPKQINFLRQPKGTFSPMYEVYDQENRLEGFAWRIDEKPQDYFGPGAYRALLRQDSLDSVQTARAAADNAAKAPKDSLAQDTTAAPSATEPGGATTAGASATSDTARSGSSSTPDRNPAAAPGRKGQGARADRRSKRARQRRRREIWRERRQIEYEHR